MSVSYSIFPLCVARGEVDVGDDGVVWIGGIDFPRYSADEFFVLSDVAERTAFKGRRLDARYSYLGNACLCHLKGCQQSGTICLLIV